MTAQPSQTDDPRIAIVAQHMREWGGPPIDSPVGHTADVAMRLLAAIDLAPAPDEERPDLRLLALREAIHAKLLEVGDEIRLAQLEEMADELADIAQGHVQAELAKLRADLTDEATAEYAQIHAEHDGELDKLTRERDLTRARLNHVNRLLDGTSLRARAMEFQIERMRPVIEAVRTAYAPDRESPDQDFDDLETAWIAYETAQNRAEVALSPFRVVDVGVDGEMERLTQERDEARAQVEQLRAELAKTREVLGNMAIDKLLVPVEATTELTSEPDRLTVDQAVYAATMILTAHDGHRDVTDVLHTAERLLLWDAERHPYTRTNPPPPPPFWESVQALQDAYDHTLADLELLERQRDRVVWLISQPGNIAAALRAQIREAFLSDPATGRGYREPMPRHQHHCPCGQTHTITLDLSPIEGALAEVSHQLRAINRKQTLIMTALTDLKTELTAVFADLAAKIARLQASVDNPSTETRFSPEDQVAFDEIKATVDAARATVGDEDGSDLPPVDPTVPVL